MEAARNEEQLRMMKEMKALSVDITKVLISQQPHFDNVIKLDAGGGKAEARADGKEVGRGLLGALQLNL